MERCRAAGVNARELEDLPIQDTAPAPLHAARLWLHLLRSGADVVHAHTGDAAMRAADTWALRMLKRSTVRVATPQGGVWQSDSQTKQWAEAIAAIDGVVSPSEFAASFQRAGGIPNEQIRVVHNAIDAAAIRQGRRAVLRAELGLRPEQPLILFFARLDPVKRPLETIRAFAEVAREFPDSVLAMAGTGTLEAEARELIASLGLSDRVRLLGYRTDTADCLAGADIFTLPTEWENFSLSLLEAMAAALAIITTPAGGNLEAVTDKVSAWIAPIGDVASQRDGMRFFLSDPVRRREFGAAAQARMLNEFDVPAAAQKMERALKDLASARMGPTRARQALRLPAA